MESLNSSLTNSFIKSRWGSPLLLGMVGLLAFFHNLSISLFGETEGLYAAVTETMLRTGEYVQLTLNRQPYVNKPPMFFWIQGLSGQALGLNELALRLPSALFCLGTLMVTFWLGTRLFSRTAGFWAGMVVGTSYATVWFGQMGIIDPVLTFFMTLGLGALACAYFQKGSPWWYVIGFAALAFGAMVKNLHAFAMPMLLFLLLLVFFRDKKPLQTSAFWVGVAIFVFLLGSYFTFLGEKFWQHFFFEENLKRMTMVAGDIQASAFEAFFGSRPIHWYALTIWFDFFPWSVFLPSSLILLWKRRPFHQYPHEAFILFWVLGYFLAFSLFPEKHERYLLPLVPGMGLWVGYLYHRVWSCEELRERPATLLKIMLGVLAFACMVMVSLGPLILQKKWGIPKEVFPLFYQGLMVVCATTLLYFLFRSHITKALNMAGILAVGVMVGIVVFIVPGIDAGASPRNMFLEIRTALKNPTDHIWAFQHWNWRTDEDVYYWQHVNRSALILGWGTDAAQGRELLKDKARESGRFVILMTDDQYQDSVSRDPALNVAVLREFLRPKRTIVLVSVELAR